MATPLVIAIILALAALAGAAYFASQQRGTPEPSGSVDRVGESETPPGDGMQKESVQSEREVEDTMQKPVPGVPFQGSGEVLAGSTTPFIISNQIDYDKALRENRVIMLYFSANWCPICRVELERTRAAFDELELPNLVGFRVSYNDNETDDFDENLARQFGIAYQHTKVILKGGQQVLKNGQTWSKERYIEELTRAAQ